MDLLKGGKQTHLPIKTLIGLLLVIRSSRKAEWTYQRGSPLPFRQIWTLNSQSLIYHQGNQVDFFMGEPFEGTLDSQRLINHSAWIFWANLLRRTLDS